MLRFCTQLEYPLLYRILKYNVTIIKIFFNNYRRVYIIYEIGKNTIQYWYLFIKQQKKILKTMIIFIIYFCLQKSAY